MQSIGMFQTRLVFPLRGPRHPSSLSEYEVSVFRDVEETVTAVPNIVCNNGLDIGDMVVEHNETEERIAWFLEGTCASCYIAHYAALSL